MSVLLHIVIGLQIFLVTQHANCKRLHGVGGSHCYLGQCLAIGLLDDISDIADFGLNPFLSTIVSERESYFASLSFQSCTNIRVEFYLAPSQHYNILTIITLTQQFHLIRNDGLRSHNLHQAW